MPAVDYDYNYYNNARKINRTANAKWLIDEGWGNYHDQALDLFKFKTLSVDDKFQILKNYINKRIRIKPTTSESKEKGVRIEGLDILISNSPDFTEEFMAEHLNELLEYFSKDDLKLVFERPWKPITNEKLLLLFEIL